MVEQQVHTLNVLAFLLMAHAARVTSMAMGHEDCAPASPQQPWPARLDWLDKDVSILLVEDSENSRKREHYFSRRSIVVLRSLVLTGTDGTGMRSLHDHIIIVDELHGYNLQSLSNLIIIAHKVQLHAETLVNSLLIAHSVELKVDNITRSFVYSENIALLATRLASSVLVSSQLELTVEYMFTCVVLARNFTFPSRTVNDAGNFLFYSLGGLHTVLKGSVAVTQQQCGALLVSVRGVVQRFATGSAHQATLNIHSADASVLLTKITRTMLVQITQIKLAYGEASGWTVGEFWRAITLAFSSFFTRQSESPPAVVGQVLSVRANLTLSRTLMHRVQQGMANKHPTNPKPVTRFAVTAKCSKSHFASLLPTGFKLHYEYVGRDLEKHGPELLAATIKLVITDRCVLADRTFVANFVSIKFECRDSPKVQNVTLLAKNVVFQSVFGRIRIENCNIVAEQVSYDLPDESYFMVILDSLIVADFIHITNGSRPPSKIAYELHLRHSTFLARNVHIGGEIIKVIDVYFAAQNVTFSCSQLHMDQSIVVAERMSLGLDGRLASFDRNEIFTKELHVMQVAALRGSTLTTQRLFTYCADNDERHAAVNVTLTRANTVSVRLAYCSESNRSVKVKVKVSSFAVMQDLQSLPLSLQVRGAEVRLVSLDVFNKRVAILQPKIALNNAALKLKLDVAPDSPYVSMMKEQYGEFVIRLSDLPLATRTVIISELTCDNDKGVDLSAIDSSPVKFTSIEAQFDAYSAQIINVAVLIHLSSALHNLKAPLAAIAANFTNLPNSDSTTITVKKRTETLTDEEEEELTTNTARERGSSQSQLRKLRKIRRLSEAQNISNFTWHESGIYLNEAALTTFTVMFYLLVVVTCIAFWFFYAWHVEEQLAYD